MGSFALAADRLVCRCVEAIATALLTAAACLAFYQVLNRFLLEEPSTEHRQPRAVPARGERRPVRHRGVFETSASIVILTPIPAPVAVHFGVDPIHVGIIMNVNLALGMITPRFGDNLFAACPVAGVSTEKSCRLCCCSWQ